MTRWNVSQFGTRSFKPSITAASTRIKETIQNTS